MLEQLPKVLLVDADPALRETLTAYLAGHGFSVVIASDGEEGLARFGEDAFGLALVAEALPGLSGLDVLRSIRRQGETPVVMLSASSDEIDRIVALELGADEVFSPSCNLRELLARLRSLLRRSRQSTSSMSLPAAETLGIFPAERKATWCGHPLKLTGTEFNLLAFLFNNSGRAIPKADLSKHVLGREMHSDDRSLDMHISNLRKKLGRLADGRSPIQSVRGGYQLLEPQEQPA